MSKGSEFKIIQTFTALKRDVDYSGGSMLSAYRFHAQNFNGIWDRAYTLTIL